MISISVIIPVYNAEVTLPSTLDSVINQTFQDFEIICVDDGSTDSSKYILKKYSLSEPRITIITQRNQFAGIARNNGIINSSGKYIVFLDSDDTMVPDCLESLYNRIEQTSADLVRASAFTVKNNHPEELSWCLNKSVVPKKDVFSWVDMPDTIFKLSAGNPWSMIIRADFVKDNNILFPNFPRTEDIVFTYDCYLKASKIAILDKCVINYRSQSGGMESTKIKYPLAPLESRAYLKQMIVEQGIFESVKLSFFYREFLSYYDMIDKFIKSNQTEFAKIYFEALKKEIQYCNLDFSSRDRCNVELLDIYQLAHKIYLTSSFEDFYKIQGRSKPYSVNKPSLGMQPAVSIIIPVHNSGIYLRQCLNSILNQTLTNYEVICVDDGSTDDSLSILQSYQLRFPDKFTIIHQKARNAGAARNNGMTYAHGKYLLFLDSDDTFKNTLLEQAVKKMDTTWCDILIFEANVFNNKTRRYWSADWLLKWDYVIKMDFNPNEVADVLFQITTANPWNKMYRSNYIWDLDLKYQCIQRANDVYFTFFAMANAHKISLLKEKLVNWRTNNEFSLQGSNTKTPTCFLDAYKKLRTSLINKGLFDKYEQSFVNVVISNAIYTLGSLKTVSSKRKLVNAIKKEFVEMKILDHDVMYYYDSQKYNECLRIINTPSSKYLREICNISFKSILESVKNEGLRSTLKKY